MYLFVYLSIHPIICFSDDQCPDTISVMSIRVRIAPSPTGFAHIGTAYMGLFNWAFARSHHGVFILRLEDTDQKRHVPEAEQAIYDALSWLGIEPDESPMVGGRFGPYRQSERLDRYREQAKHLLNVKAAYAKDGAIWLRMPSVGVLSWNDAVRGVISFDANNLKDWVLIKSDGFPTYNFANVIDDLDMKITHVLRGEEHISNTPLQLSAYHALNETPPIIGHLPVLRGSDHKKLSKRRDPVSLQWFRERGYLPEAILNFLALQGWSHPQEKDVFSKEEFSRLLTLERIRTSAPVFDFKKLDWLNGNYIRAMENDELALLIGKETRVKTPDELITKTLPLVKDRLRKLSEFPDLVSYFIARPTPDVELIKSQSKKDLKEIKRVLDHIISTYEKLDNWTVQKLENAGQELLSKTDWSPRELFMTIRVAVTGRTATPPLADVMEVLGKETVIERLRQVLTAL